MKVLFTIWAKVGTIRGRGRGREEEEESTKERTIRDKGRAQKSTGTAVYTRQN